jgi:uncharacterized metal-binding protein
MLLAASTVAVGVLRVMAVPGCTALATIGDEAAPLYASRTRDALLEAPSVAATVEPGLVSVAVRVKTHDRMSGCPSEAVPRRVQPAGVVAVVAVLTVTT